MHCSYYGICLLIICVSHVSIVIKTRSQILPRHHRGARRERKLTSTLSMVTLASLLTWLPHVIFSLCVIATDLNLLSTISFQTEFHVYLSVMVLSFANSLVNPVIYALRMPEFRIRMFLSQRFWGRWCRIQRRARVYNIELTHVGVLPQS